MGILANRPDDANSRAVICSVQNSATRLRIQKHLVIVIFALVWIFAHIDAPNSDSILMGIFDELMPKLVLLLLAAVCVEAAERRRKGSAKFCLDENGIRIFDKISSSIEFIPTEEIRNIIVYTYRGSVAQIELGLAQATGTKKLKILVGRPKESDITRLGYVPILTKTLMFDTGSRAFVFIETVLGLCFAVFLAYLTAQM